MMQTGAGTEDIFSGAEKVEILGKLPSFLWFYIEASRNLIRQVNAKHEQHDDAFANVEKILGVLNSAAHHIDNKKLQDHLSDQAEMLQGFGSGNLSPEAFVSKFLPAITKLEGMAGSRRDASHDMELEKLILSRELEKADKIKTGRSADIVVNVNILDDVRNYLSKEVMTEGISSVLIIDSAGSLVVNIGDKIELDVVSLAAVAAANFAATEQIARLIGEQDFVLLFYKGRNESFHFTRVGSEYIIVTIFNNALSLGLLRLKIAEVARVLETKLPKRQG
jgi:predicted regulator of Ras-like GTPase activity (Roadblock/LC7/MglB family)